MTRKAAADFSPQVLKLFDDYVSTTTCTASCPAGDLPEVGQAAWRTMEPKCHRLNVSSGYCYEWLIKRHFRGSP